MERRREEGEGRRGTEEGERRRGGGKEGRDVREVGVSRRRGEMKPKYKYAKNVT